MKKELNIAKGQALFIDPNTGARTLARPFKLPDNTDAMLMITRLKKTNWFPEKEIKNITIEYYEEN